MAADGDTGRGGDGPTGTVYGALSNEAADLAGALRLLEADFSDATNGAVPERLIVSAQALDRVSQGLEDFARIFARLDRSHAADPTETADAALARAIDAARQDDLRRRLLRQEPAPSETAGEIDLF